MSLLFADGFEHYGIGATGRTNMLRGAWALVNGYSPTDDRARTGTLSLRTQNAAIARLSLNGLKSVVGVGVGLNMVTLPTNSSKIGIEFIDQSGNPLLAICPGSDGSIAVKDGDVGTGTIIGVTDSILSAGGFNHIETKVLFDDIVGSCEIRVNGIVVFNSTNMNLGITPCASINLIQYTNVGPIDHSWDDLVVWDDNGDHNNDFIGPARVLTLFANGDTAQADWPIVGSGTGYGAIDDTIPDDDATYIGTDVADNVSEFTLPDLPTELASISGVFVQTMARSDEAGISNVQTSMVSNDIALLGSDYALTPAYVYYRNSFDYDPNTNEPWTKSSFEAALLRVEKTV